MFFVVSRFDERCDLWNVYDKDSYDNKSHSCSSSEMCPEYEYVATGCMAGTSIVIERSALKWPLALLV